MMKMDLIDKVKFLAQKQGMSMSALARATGRSPQCMHAKFKLANMRQSEVQEIADALGYGVKVVFYDLETGEDVL